MAKGFKHGAGGTVNLGGGGVELNFEVVGNPQPETATENMIWVDTDYPISEWEFNPNEPETMTEGMMWFQMDVSSTTPINALKENAILLYPIFAKQCVDGVWVEKAAKCSQGEEWVEIKSPKLWVIQNGIEIIEFQLQTATKTAVDGFLRISGSGDGNHGAGAIVDVTNFKNLVLEGEIDTFVGYLCMWDIGTTGFTFNNAVSYIKSDDTRGGILPVETYSGKYRVGVAIIGGRSHKIANLYLE